MDGEVPELTEYGLLPPGLHELNLEQIRELFGSFQRSDRRPTLFRKLQEFVVELRATGWRAALLIDGSFVMTRVDEPEDIDAVLVLPTGWDYAAELRPFEYNLVSKRMTRKRFGLDVFAVEHGTRREAEMIEFFQGVNLKWRNLLDIPREEKKGIVKVIL